MELPTRLKSVILLAFCVNLCIAQTQFLCSFSSANGSVDEIKQINNTLILSGYTILKTVDLSSNALQDRDAGQLRYKQAYNSTGMFSVKVANNQYYLKFQNQSTDFTSTVVAVTNNSNFPIGGLICNEKYYVIVPTNNIYNLWESDGTSAGTKIIYTSSNSLPSMAAIGDTLIFSHYNGTGYDLCSYKPNGITQVFSTISGVPTFVTCKNDNNHYYFTRSDSTGTWKGNTQGLGAIFNYSVTGNLVFNNGIYYLVGWGQSFYNPQSISTIYKCTPYNYHPIKFIKQDSTKTLESYQAIDDKFVISESTDYGYEIAYYDHILDSFRLIKDLRRGPGNGLYANYNKTAGGNYLLATAYNNELYYIATNGNDAFYYLYKTDGLTQTSLFKIVINYGITSLYVNNGYVYWCDKDASKKVTRVFKRKLTDTDPAQPSVKTNSDEWSKFFQFYCQNAVSQPFPISYESQSDTKGNIVSSFLFCTQGQNFSFCASDSNVRKNQASNVFTKTDKYGNLKWTTSIGQLNTNFASSSRFCIDKNGNIVITGSYFGSAAFGTDTIKQASTGPCNAFFIAKLNGNDGSILWKKIIACTPYSDDIQLDKMIADNHNNVYISFLHKSNASFLNSNLTYSLEPVNTLMKLRDTNLIWARNIPTPWKNFYGRTYNLLFDSLNTTLICTQTQSYYNMSSSCGYSGYSNYIQKADTLGNIIFTKEIPAGDISNLPAASIINNSIFYPGYVRGALSIDGHNVTTSYDAATSCNKIESFTYLADRTNNSFKALRVLDNSVFSPFNSVTDDKYIYVLGAESTNASLLTIKKFDENGKLIARRTFNHPVQEQIYFLPNYNIMIDGDHLIVSGFTRNTVDTLINPLYSSPYSFFDYVIWKFNKNNGWQEDGDDKMIYLISTDNDIISYPNPTDSKVFFQIKNPDSIKYVEIYDVLGKLVMKPALSQEVNQYIDISTLPRGTYIIKLFGETNYTKKIVKL